LVFVELDPRATTSIHLTPFALFSCQRTKNHRESRRLYYRDLAMSSCVLASFNEARCRRSESTYSAGLGRCQGQRILRNTSPGMVQCCHVAQGLPRIS